MYTSHGYMTGADLAEVRADYDLDLCGCCESDTFEQDEEEEEGRCTCGHEHCAGVMFTADLEVAGRVRIPDMTRGMALPKRLADHGS